MKNASIIRLLLFVTLFFALINSIMVFSITASISNPRMVLRVNVSKETPGYLENAITVNNNNDYEILVEVQPDDVLKSLNAELSTTRFKLMPNESKNVNFKLTVTNVGLYDGKLLVSFRGKPLDSLTEEQIGVAAGIVVIASGENYTGVINQKPKPTQSPTNTQTPTQKPTTETEPKPEQNITKNENMQNPNWQENSEGEIISKGENPLIGVLIMIIIVGIGVILFLKIKRR